MGCNGCLRWVFEYVCMYNEVSLVYISDKLPYRCNMSMNEHECLGVIFCVSVYIRLSLYAGEIQKRKVHTAIDSI